MANFKSPTVAFQGELGAFSSIAAGKLVPGKSSLLPCQTFPDVFRALRSGEAAYAVVPIENTLYGSVYENYDHLLECDVPIIGETAVRIEHHLIAPAGVRLRDVRRAFSHPVALGQCLRFLQQHPSIVPAPFYDTAGSVKMLMQQNWKDAAAIASSSSAEIYGGEILRRNIEDDRRNFTRFFLLSKQKDAFGEMGSQSKTSLVFATPNVPGALFKALACFALRGLNLTKIESRPLRKKPWEYLFYVDFLGYSEDPRAKKAISNLEEMSAFVKILGTYNSIP